MKRRGLRWRWPLLAVLPVALLVVVQACGRTATEVRFVDLVADQRLRVDGLRLRPAEVVVFDETWVAVTLEDGADLRADFDVFDEPSLTLAGSLDCGESGDRETAGGLEGSIGSAHGGRVDLAINFDAGDGWWQRTIDLDAVSGTSAELAIHADLPEGCVLRLREATLRHLTAIENPPPANRKQLLLISVDTLRNDALGLSDGLSRTPHLDRFAGESESWTTAYAAASWTKPSHASMLTGYYPETHRAVLLDQAMDAAVPTLAGRFRRAGYATGGLVFDCTWLSPRWGFGKGFDSYRVTPYRAGRQAREAVGWLLDHRDEDFFFFLHTFEPHSDFALLPYEAPGLNRRTIASEFGVEGFGCRRGLCGARFVTALSNGEVPERPRDAVILRETYSRGVDYLDAALGELFDTLKQSGVWDELLVVVTSDHGEEFSEHGSFGHHALYDEITRVPLLIKWPQGKRAGVVNTIPCSGVDIAPTLLEHAGLPSAGMAGTPLRSRDAEMPILSGTLEHAVVRGGFKAIFSSRQPPRLFNLAEDPDELVNLAEVRPDVVETLRDILAAQRREALALYRSFGSEGNDSNVELSERDRQRLEAFGYLQ